MKKFFTIASLALLFVSCASYYNFVQVCKVQAKDESQNLEQGEFGYVYKDSNCNIHYGFWSEGGDAGFIFENITDEILYLDLTKTFFIVNDFAFNYSSGMNMTMTTGKSNETSVASAKSFTENNSQSEVVPFAGYTKSTSSEIQNMEKTMASSEVEVIAIPPHSKKLIRAYGVYNKDLLHCDLQRFPSESASVKLDEQETPLSFGNYITYHKENGKEHIVKNEFYISEISNYSEPEAIQYVLRDTLCQNLTNNTNKKYTYQYPVKVYDRQFKVGGYNAFYNYYKVYTDRALYKSESSYYYYNYTYDGYVRGDSGWISSSSDASTSKSVGTVGFHTY